MQADQTVPSLPVPVEPIAVERARVGLRVVPRDWPVGAALVVPTGPARGA